MCQQCIQFYSTPITQEDNASIATSKRRQSKTKIKLKVEILDTALLTWVGASRKEMHYNHGSGTSQWHRSTLHRNVLPVNNWAARHIISYFTYMSHIWCFSLGHRGPDNNPSSTRCHQHWFNYKCRNSMNLYSLLDVVNNGVTLMSNCKYLRAMSRETTVSINSTGTSLSQSKPGHVMLWASPSSILPLRYLQTTHHDV